MSADSGEWKRVERGHDGAQEREMARRMHGLWEQGRAEEAREIWNDLALAYQSEAEEIIEKLVVDGKDPHEVESTVWEQVAYLIKHYDSSEELSLQQYVGHYLNPGSVASRLPRRGGGQSERTNFDENVFRSIIDEPKGGAIDIGLALSRLRILVTQLPERQRQVIERRYDLDGQGGATLKAVGEELGVTKQNIKTTYERPAIEGLRRLAIADEILQILKLEEIDIVRLLQKFGGKPIRYTNPVGRPGQRKS